MDRIDTLLLGRSTYEIFAGLWPNVTEGEEKDFADKFNAVAKVVFSKTPKRAPWGKRNEARIVMGKDMLISDSISMAQSLIVERMVDEYQLVLCPVALGRPTPLSRRPIRHDEAAERAQASRAVSLIYRPWQS